MFFPQARKRFFQNINNSFQSKKGNGMEFLDFTNYNPGDNARYIDWKSYAKTGNLYKKNFIDEKGLNISIIIDNGISINTKKNLQEKIKNLIISQSKKEGDSIKIYFYDDKNFGPRVKSNNFFSNLDQALEKFLEKKIEKNVVIIISDDFCKLEFLQKIHQKNEIYFLNIFSTQDIKPKKIFGMSSRWIGMLFWKSFEKKIGQKIENFGQECKKNQIKYLYLIENNYTLKQIYNFFSS